MHRLDLKRRELLRLDQLVDARLEGRAERDLERLRLLRHGAQLVAREHAHELLHLRARHRRPEADLAALDGSEHVAAHQPLVRRVGRRALLERREDRLRTARDVMLAGVDERVRFAVDGALAAPLEQVRLLLHVECAQHRALLTVLRISSRRGVQADSSPSRATELTSSRRDDLQRVERSRLLLAAELAGGRHACRLFAARSR